MIDSPILLRWGVGFLIVTSMFDFYRFGTMKLQTSDWVSVATASVGLTMVALAGLDMALNKDTFELFAPADYDNIYLEHDPEIAIVDEMAGLGMGS